MTTAHAAHCCIGGGDCFLLLAAGAAAAGGGGHCLSENVFAPDAPDCVQFAEGADLASAQEACEAGEFSMPGATGKWAEGTCSAYESEAFAGECVYESEDGVEARSVMVLGGPANCQFLGSMVCGTFIPGGAWNPGPACGGTDEAGADEAAETDERPRIVVDYFDPSALIWNQPGYNGSAALDAGAGYAYPDGDCPPEGFDAVAGLNLTAWAEAPWYPLAQMPLAYQGVDTFYCVRASYKLVDESTVQVQNTAQDKDGTPSLEEGSPFEFLRAIVPDPEEPAKLAVGPPNLPPETYGSYWVVAAGSATRRPRNDISYTLSDGPPEGPFDWGIVSGGAPKDSSPGGGCIAGAPGGFNEAGLWLFSREPLAGAAAEAMREALVAKARALGLGVGALEPVWQGEDASCEYPPVLPVQEAAESQG